MSTRDGEFETIARELLSREYGPDHPAARHRFTLSFLTTTHEHQVREIGDAIRRAVTESTAHLENLGTENVDLRVRLARLHTENADLKDGLEACEGRLERVQRECDALLVAKNEAP